MADGKSSTENVNPVRGRIRRLLNGALGATYFGLLFVAWGAAAVRYEVFPHRYLNLSFTYLEDTKLLVDLLWQANIEKQHPHEIMWPEGLAPRAEVPSAISRDEMTLIEAFRDGVFGLYLVNGEGEIEHRWSIPESVYRAALPHGEDGMRDDFKWTDGSHLYPNGDVVFTLDYYGVVRMDRCSAPQWVLPGEYHHALFVDHDGDIWTPYREIINDPMPEYPWIEPPFGLEGAARISPDGVLQEVFYLPEAAVGGADFEGLIAQGRQSEPRTVDPDITHLNDVEIIGADFAAANPQFNVGDIIVSMRTLDAVAVIDRETGKFKFSLAGMMLRQHDPDALPNGNLLIFDNRMEKGQHNALTYIPEGQWFGGSRIFEINPRTQEIVWTYEGDEENPFFTSIQGKHESLDNGNVLIVETEGGRVFEVERATGDIVWQFNNLIGERNGSPVYGRVLSALRYQRSELPFLNAEPCSDS